ncbi:MAG: AMP-binding protein [Gordonibacter pamelaeae]
MRAAVVPRHVRLDACHAGAGRAPRDSRFAQAGRHRRDIVRTGATRTALVPCLMRGLANYVAREGIELDTLELVIYGGEPVEPELLEHCRRLLPCGFLQGYGMTETTAAITMLLPEHHEHPRLLPTVGKAVPGMEIRIVDDEGRACAAGVPGEVLVRTDTLMLGYYRDPARTAEAVQDGGIARAISAFWTQRASSRWWTVRTTWSYRGARTCTPSR